MPKNEVAKTTGTAVAVPDYGDLAGAGYENQTAEDMAIPMLALLQSLSPEVDSEVDEYIEGAVAGRFINSVTKQLFPEEGVIIVPCHTDHVFVEWVPRKQGGGFVGIHQQNSPIVAAAKANAEDFGKYKHGDNDLVETFYIYALLLNEVDDTVSLGPIVIPFKSMAIKAYKSLMTTLRTIKGNPPLFCHRLRVTSVSQSNSKGKFKNFHFAPANGDTIGSMIPPVLDGQRHPLLVEAMAFASSIKSGEKKADHAGASTGAAQRTGEAADDEPPF